jgi:peroxiredoxin Q/BCP
MAIDGSLMAIDGSLMAIDGSLMGIDGSLIAIGETSMAIDGSLMGIDEMRVTIGDSSTGTDDPWTCRAERTISRAHSPTTGGARLLIMLAVGEHAPDFFLASNRGQPVRLSEFANRKAVVLYFYPKDDTPACTVEACGFRDAYEQFRDAGAEVVGVSSDDFEAHRRFAEKYELPFLLLSDPGGKVRERYGVKPTMWVLPGRATFVIDKGGIIRHRFASQIQVGRHIEEALAVVKRLVGQSAEHGPAAS